MGAESVMVNLRIPIPTLLFVLLLAFLWGGNTVAVKVSFQGIPPLASAGIRFSLGLVVVGIFSRVKGISLRPCQGEILPLFMIGMLFTAQIVTFTLGTFYTRAGRASVLINTYPIFVAFLAHFLIADDRLSKLKGVGLFLAFSGILLIFGENFLKGGTGFWFGDALVVLSGFMLALLAVLMKRLLHNIDGVRLLFSEMVLGVPLFFILSLFFEREYSWALSLPILTGLFYQGIIVGGICFIGWLSVLKRYPPSRLSVLFFTTPLWGLLLSRVILNEPLAPWLAVGAVLVAAGIVITNVTLRGNSIHNFSGKQRL